MLTVVINTFQQGDTVPDVLLSVLRLSFAREVIVVDDGSTDGTWEHVLEIASQHEDTLAWKLFRMRNKGGVQCRRHGFAHSTNRYCLLLGGDFVVHDEEAIDAMLREFSDDVAFVSLYGPHGGMGTIYDRDAVAAVGGFALAFNRFGSGYRDDSDLYYRLQAAGYRSVFLPHLRAAYDHRQALPQGRFACLRYILHRVRIHELDVLLFKRHPVRFSADFDVRLGCVVNPLKDYYRATGRWKVGQAFALSSPQGVTLLSGTTAARRVVIRLGGVAYAVALMAVRLKGSCRYRTLLL